MIAELKALPPKQVVIEKVLNKHVEVTGRIGDRVERLMEMYDKNNKWKKMQLAFTMLYYYKNFRYYLKLTHQRKEKVVVNQTLEVYDGTLEVWNYSRTALMNWLFDVFVRSADRAYQRKMNSYILFKCNMEEIREGISDVSTMLITTYSRLKNLVREEMPKIDWERKFVLPEGVPQDLVLNLDPENLQVKDDCELRDKINQWVENTLYYVILRKKYDRIDKDKVFFLFLKKRICCICSDFWQLSIE